MLTLRHELGMGREDVRALADHLHNFRDISSVLASGSFPVDGMLIAPCSIRALSGVAHSYGDDLLVRAADVTLKEGRPLVLMVRETPFHLGHLRLMLAAAEMGAVIAPPVPAFHTRPETIEDIVEYSVSRALTRLGLPAGHQVWNGLRDAAGQSMDRTPNSSSSFHGQLP
jgi:4-hydroxy-3-polyprenylbenzoate decarboxylase